VVDNDPAASARPIFEEMANGSRAELAYASEMKPGIARARNRALDESENFEFMAFLDDDEVAPPNWLDNLMAALRKYNADVVTGPVRPCFESAPDWVIQGGFFAEEQRETGSIPKFVASNNVLMKCGVALRFRFDERFNNTSGEDTHYFMRIRDTGAKIVWSREAIVEEFVPASRTTEEWIVQRCYSNGNRYTRCCLYLYPGARTVAVRSVKGIAFILTGLLSLPLARGKLDRKVKSWSKVKRGIGICSAVIGKADVYYRKPGVTAS
jgi:GT2 family glycosyltransferase